MNPFQRKYLRLLTARLFDRDVDLLSLRTISIQRKLAPGLSAGSWLSFATLSLAGVTNPWLYLFPLVGSVSALFLDEESDRAAALLMPLINQRDEARRIGEKELLESQLVCLKEMLAGQEEWVRAQLPQAPQYASLPPAPVASNPLLEMNSNQSPANHWFNELLEYPLILFFGAPGSGKTTTAAALIHKRVKRGHRVIVCDPHRKFGAWEGLEVVGDGLNYDQIDRKLEWVAEEIQRRYQRYSSELNPEFEPLTIVCDEFTNWGARCEHSEAFIDAAIADIRKIDVCIVIVSHMNTLKGMGGGSGVARAIDASFIQVELLSQPHPVTKKAAPKLEGWMKFPGQSRQERSQICLEPWMDCSMNFTKTEVEDDGGLLTRHSPDTHQALTANAPHLEALLDGGYNEHSPIPENWERQDPLEAITPEIRALVIACRRAGMSQNKTLPAIWACSKGGTRSRSYSAAREAYQSILKTANLL